MDFDEYEYLEKTVDESKKSKKDGEERERSREHHRKRDKLDEGEERERDRDREEDSEERRKKKSRGGGEDEKENGSGRERRRDRDGERRDRDKDRERRDREKREKERERERERVKERRSSSRSRRHESREREREGKEREKSRDREREKSRDRERERSRDRELREFEMRERDGRRFRDKKDAAEPEADPERDQRTVFAYQMPLKATERDVYEFFSKAGKVRDVRLIMDRNSRRSKGVGYIEFYESLSVPMAITLSGQLLLGQPVMVKPSEAEKNLVQPTATGGSSVTGPYGPTDRKLYVGNLHFNMTEQQLRLIFEAFGHVELVQLPLDPETGHCKGFGFVQFATAEAAKQAQSLNGKLEIAGRFIKVSSVTEHVGGGQETGTTAADFDDDDGGGLALNARSRAMLMQKLDRTGTASSIADSLGVPAFNGAAAVQQPYPLPQTGVPGLTVPGQVLLPQVAEPIGTPSDCLLLKNLFDPSTETEPDFDLDIKEDVEAECSKFGAVRHAYVDKHSAGHVYLRFVNQEGAMQAQRGMHGRWFARKMISAIYMPTQDYVAKFPEAA